MARPSRPADKVHNRATVRAAQWVRAEHPEQWQRILEAAYLELGIEHRPLGRPPGSSSSSSSTVRG